MIQTTGIASTTMTWDYHHWLTQMGTGTQTLSYVYDHTGSRVKMATSSGATPTYYVGKYYETRGNTKTKHIYDNRGTLLASVETVGGTITPYYVHTDHLGGTNIVTDANGTATQTLDYLPFGSKRITSGGDVTSREYIGEVFDESTQLSYLNARYYEGSRGQFISQDPSFLDIGTSKFEEKYERKLQQHLMNPQALNSYSYALNNPTINKDPDGEIVPLLVAAYIAVEVGLSAYDAYSTAATLSNPNASGREKAFSAGGFIAGLALPGGGYGTAGKQLTSIINIAESRLKHVMERHTQDGVKFIEGKTSYFNKGEDVKSLINEASLGNASLNKSETGSGTIK